MRNTLKQYLLLLGGFVGFTATFAVGLAAGNDIVQVLFNAAIGCMVGGLLFKWIAVLLIESLIVQKKKAATIAAAAAAAASTSNVVNNIKKGSV